MVSLDRPLAAAARRSLLRWYQRRSRKLPWRESKNPYTVWVSEIMLQQTQIETVIPYYQRFIREFPTVSRLAEAPLERVLELWSGLGYYRRATNLHQAAREIAAKHGGAFPREMEQALSMPGVGNYTARAVLSIAYNQPYAVLDGNVARVMARVLALRGNLHQPRFRRLIEENLELLLSRRSPGNFNQAMMELGQTLCLPRSPRCSVCPLCQGCGGFQLGRAASYPEPRPRRQAEEWHLATAVLYRNQQVMLIRGLDDGLLGDLWNFPSALGQTSKEALARLREKLRSELGTAPLLAAPEHKLHHNITHRSIQVHVYEGNLSTGPVRGKFRWFHSRTIERAAVSQLARKIARNLGATI
ncbi:MAG TPA: A/G-specific adenine glycosylase [Terriglobia bacterium]|nr:A/G-specific adenine glycosylase [Terriglobia bacterium]